MSAENQQNLYRYEDILRAIGRYIDTNQIQDVILMQSNDGIVLRGYRHGGTGAQTGPTLVQHLFTSDDLKAIDEVSRKRRGRGSPIFG